MIAVLQPTRSRTATSCVALALALALCSVGGDSEAAAPRPHIIFNMIDGASHFHRCAMSV
jgi:hypothetical protein|eukprot:COSAG06_NODE_28719_length_569_cov_1.251064_2_plen_60_part_00